MQILRLRRGFQADHSSSSYLFYAADQPVGPEGQAIAHRFSSRAEVGKRTARYVKWGESDLSYSAYKALLEKHYDVMVSESYGWWSMLIAVPKTAEMQRLLAPFHDARGGDDLGVSVEDYGQRLAIEVSCALVDDGADFSFGHDDVLAYVAKLLVRIRDEILAGNTSFLSAVASFYGADEEDEEEESGETDAGVATEVPLEKLRKAELQRECAKRGIDFRRSWTKDQLREALQAATTSSAAETGAAGHSGAQARLSRAAREIVDNLDMR
jgi:hypothetical protein